MNALESVCRKMRRYLSKKGELPSKPLYSKRSKP